MKKDWRKLWRKVSRKISRMIPKMIPRTEDVLFFFFILIAASFGAALLTTNERIKKDNFGYVAPQPVYIDQELKAMVIGTPMEKMVPYLSQKDKKVASYLVAIAKKESNWGRFSPKKDGKECYNYWGYRGSENTTSSGYSCFRNPRQAVSVVGGRIAELLDQKIDTPREMVVWKCGRDCAAAGGNAAAEKWIADVAYYYRKLNNQS